jgi:hypothetical protein
MQETIKKSFLVMGLNVFFSRRIGDGCNITQSITCLLCEEWFLEVRN